MTILDQFFPRPDGESAADVMAAANRNTITWSQYRAAQRHGIEIKKDVRVVDVPDMPPAKRRRSLRWY